MRKVELTTDTTNDAGSKDFMPKTELVMEFFIERKPGANPIAVNTKLREILGGLKGVNAVTPGRSDESSDGIVVVHTVELDLGLERGSSE
jgi:hypothetical protein